MQVKTVNLTCSAAQLKQYITEHDKSWTGEGKQGYRQDYLSMHVRNKDNIKVNLVWSQGCIEV